MLVHVRHLGRDAPLFQPPPTFRFEQEAHEQGAIVRLDRSKWFA